MVERYAPCFSDLATEFILNLPKRRQRRAVDCAYTLARRPTAVSDYIMLDSAGHKVEHLLTEGFIFAYWIDHAHRLVMITEIDDAKYSG